MYLFSLNKSPFHLNFTEHASVHYCNGAKIFTNTRVNIVLIRRLLQHTNLCRRFDFSVCVHIVRGIYIIRSENNIISYAITICSTLSVLIIQFQISFIDLKMRSYFAMHTCVHRNVLSTWDSLMKHIFLSIYFAVSTIFALFSY